MKASRFLSRVHGYGRTLLMAGAAFGAVAATTGAAGHTPFLSRALDLHSADLHSADLHTAEMGAAELVPLPEPAFASPAPAVSDTRATPEGEALLGDTLYGRSGMLRARLIAPAERPLAISVLQRLFGDSVRLDPGVYALPDSLASRPFAFLSLVPFTEKRNGRIGRYRIGSWPGEQRTVARQYANPQGFIVVTPENRDMRVSENFRLRDFLTKGQDDVWPKYLVLNLDLVDKLELVIQDLKERGYPVKRMVVFSGFRTPFYNANGGSTGGRASLSRHMYGDAADIFVDNDGRGRMADLNGDGRVNAKDVRIVLESVERVERRWPDLVGGAGLYPYNPVHGAFAHIDVRGNRARWGGA